MIGKERRGSMRDIEEFLKRKREKVVKRIRRRRGKKKIFLRVVKK